ncbi:MAG: hypothetical protein JSV24_06900 [Bacteroidales bacterium]|nr:MAG: hypothetical protein JSV24_06900 [Bacteroidales bacterium]
MFDRLSRLQQWEIIIMGGATGPGAAFDEATLQLPPTGPSGSMLKVTKKNLTGIGDT